MQQTIFDSFTLPNGVTIKNRIAKAAMEECMGSKDHLPNEQLFRLYEQWATGGSGLIITGNVMIDALAMTQAGGVALEKDTPLQRFEQWAKAIQKNGAKAIMQINHPGRQIYKSMGGKILAPSAIPLDLGRLSKLFGTPKAMTEQDIQTTIQQFIATAQQAERAGFDGVEVHAAHGYLLAQFLSPRSNKRQDQWGGSLENRARMLLEIVKGIQTVCSPEFIVSVKVNSADFQRGGFDVADAKQVVSYLADLKVDFVEVSGGNYEAPALQGRTADGRTLAKEAFFLEFAAAIAKETNVPIMTTGGIKRLSIANEVIQNGVDFIGIATALAFDPDLPKIWQKDPNYVGYVPKPNWKNNSLNGLVTLNLVRRQLERLGNGKATKRQESALKALVLEFVLKERKMKEYRQLHQL